MLFRSQVTGSEPTVMKSKKPELHAMQKRCYMQFGKTFLPSDFGKTRQPIIFPDPYLATYKSMSRLTSAERGVLVESLRAELD